MAPNREWNGPLNKLANPVGSTPTISSTFGVQWDETRDVTNCPFGGCSVYLLKSDGKIIANGSTLLSEAKAVRSIGTQGGETQRAIEAAVPVANKFKTSSIGCRGILTTSDTCPSLFGLQAFGGDGVWFTYFLDCTDEAIPKDSYHMTPLNCPTTKISNAQININNLKVGDKGCGEYVTVSDSCLSLYDIETVSMSNVANEFYKNCDGTFSGSMQPAVCTTRSLHDAGYTLNDLKVCPANCGGYVTVAEKCPTLYTLQDWRDKGKADKSYWDYFKQCEGDGIAADPVLCDSVSLEL